MILELYGGPRDGEWWKGRGKLPSAIVFPASLKSRRKPIAIYDLEVGQAYCPPSHSVIYRRLPVPRDPRRRVVVFAYDPHSRDLVRSN
jgi:hypothetical protein